MSEEEQEQYFTLFSYSSRCHLRLEHTHTQQLLLVAKAALFKERYKALCLMF